MMKLEMLSAGRGDCLILEYGVEGSTHRVLIDGGMPGSSEALRARLRSEPRPHFELVVVTHVDLDHIGGLLKLFQAGNPPFTFDDLWFNGYSHMKPYLADTLGEETWSAATEQGNSHRDLLGPAQGDALAKLLRKGPWNEAFDRKALVVPASGVLPQVRLPGGLSLTLLSPSPAGLGKMSGVWKREVETLEDELGHAESGDDSREEPADMLGEEIDAEALASQREVTDDSEANGSSIALLAEYDGRSILLGADAWPQVLSASIQRLLKERGKTRLPVSAVKVPHHGSKKNLTKDLLGLLDCEKFLISTNGSRFKHPDAEAIARIVTHRDGVKLYFNAESTYTKPWKSSGLQARHGFTAKYPIGGAPMVVEV